MKSKRDKKLEQIFKASKKEVDSYRFEEFKNQLGNLLLTEHTNQSKPKSFLEFLRKFGYKVPLSIAASFLLTFSLVISYSLTNNNSQESTSNISEINSGRVAIAEGDVRIIDRIGVERIITEDFFVEENTTVKLSGESKAKLDFENGSSLRVANDSEVKVSKVEDSKVVINHEFGEIYTVSTNGNSEVEIVTDEATYVAKNASYRIIRNTERNSVEVFENELEVLFPDGTRRIVTNGEKLFVKNTALPESVGIVLAIDTSLKDTDEFLKWNNEVDKKKPIEQDVIASNNTNEDIKNPSTGNTEDTASIASFNPQQILAEDFEYSAYSNNSGIILNWELNQTNQVKILGDLSLQLLYWPENELETNANWFNVDLQNQETQFIPLQDGQTYRTKACIYVESPQNCIFFRTQRVTAPATPEMFVDINFVTDEQIRINWSQKGFDKNTNFRLKIEEVSNVTLVVDQEVSGNGTFEFTRRNGRAHLIYVCSVNQQGECVKKSPVLDWQAPLRNVQLKINVVNLDTREVGITFENAKFENKQVLLVWSETEVYPDNLTRFSNTSSIRLSMNVVSNQDRFTTSLGQYLNDNKYYLRACEIKDGRCVLYSNQIELNLD